jgi:hypothetical protein
VKGITEPAGNELYELGYNEPAANQAAGEKAVIFDVGFTARSWGG